MIKFKSKSVLKLFLKISPANYSELLIKRMHGAKRLSSSNMFSIKWSKTKYRIIFQITDNVIYIFDVGKRENIYKNNLITNKNISINDFNWIS